MAKDPVRIGIIGCGGIARAHHGAYRENGVTPVAFTDVAPEPVEALVRENGAGEIYPNFKALIDQGKVDAVSICTPPSAHEEAAVYALEKGVAVLCEKPLANSIESGKRIVQAAKHSGALLMTGFTHRFRPAIRQIRQMILDDTIGPVVLFSNAFCGPADALKDKWFSKKAIAGGGSMMDTSSHSVDLFRFLVGEIAGQNAFHERHWEGIDVEDTAVISVKSETGAIGTLISSWVAGAGVFYIDIIGRNGRITYRYGDSLQVSSAREGEKTVPVDTSSGFKEEIANFLAAVQGKEDPGATGSDGLRALEIIFSCY